MVHKRRVMKKVNQYMVPQRVYLSFIHLCNFTLFSRGKFQVRPVCKPVLNLLYFCCRPFQGDTLPSFLHVLCKSCPFILLSNFPDMLFKTSDVRNPPHVKFVYIYIGYVTLSFNKYLY